MPKPKPAKRFKKDGLRVFVYAQNKSPGRLGRRTTRAEKPIKRNADRLLQSLKLNIIIAVTG